MDARDEWYQQHIVEGRDLVRDLQLNEHAKSETVVALENRARYCKAKMDASRNVDDVSFTTYSSRYVVVMEALMVASKEAEKYLVEYINRATYLRAAEKQLREREAIEQAAAREAAAREAAAREAAAREAAAREAAAAAAAAVRVELLAVAREARIVRGILRGGQHAAAGAA